LNEDIAMEYLKHIAEWATEGAVAMLIWSNINLWRALYAFQKDIAEKYVRAADLSPRLNAIDATIEKIRSEQKTDLDAVRATTTRILELVAEIRGKTNVHGTIVT
jgi:hypothetical protein